MGCLLGAGPSSAACPAPPEYANVTTVQDGDILVTFAADQHVYLEGQTVRFFLSFENTGSEEVYIPAPHTPEYQILILPDTCLSVDQPGCESIYARLPEGVYFFSPGTFIDPGECRVDFARWDDISSALFPAGSGGYRVFGGLTDGWTVFSVPTGENAELLFKISTTSGIPEGPVPSTWGRVKALYRQSVSS